MYMYEMCGYIYMWDVLIYIYICMDSVDISQV